MKFKDILSIILGIVAIVSLVIFIRSVSDVNQFVKAVLSGLVTSISAAIVIIWNPWLIGKS